MKNVTHLYRHPSECHDRHEQQIIEWTDDNTRIVKDRTYGRVTGGAIVLLTDRGEVVTAYAGDVRIFTMVGALKHMGNRIFKENMQDDEQEGD